MRDAETVPRTTLARVMSAPLNSMPRRRRRQTGDDLDKLGLPVALDTGDADNLALAHGQVDGRQAGSCPVDKRDIVQAEHRITGARGFAQPKS